MSELKGWCLRWQHCHKKSTTLKKKNQHYLKTRGHEAKYLSSKKVDFVSSQLFQMVIIISSTEGRKMLAKGGGVESEPTPDDTSTK